MLYIHKVTLAYPVTEQDIRNAYPNTSFPQPFQAPDEYAWVFPAPAPTVTNLQIAREIAPALTDKGHYEQQWEVVEKFATQEEIDAFLEAERKTKVPTAVSMRQARLALLAAGLLDDITAAITAFGQAAAIEWEYATEVRRDSPLIAVVQANAGLSDRQVDDLFVAASAL